jgi:hypothetical protein
VGFDAGDTCPCRASESKRFLSTKGGFHLLVQGLEAPMLQRFISDGNLKEIITCWRFLLGWKRSFAMSCCSFHKVFGCRAEGKSLRDVADTGSWHQ